MMNSIPRLWLLTAALLTAAAPAAAQDGPMAMHTTLRPGGGGAATDEAARLSRSLARGGYAVVIDLDRNRLFFRQGETVLWSAPIGTGTGLRLETGEREWDFSTPNGVFHVQYKEENPVWIAPDWYFIENDLPIPPANDKRRRFPGGLGAAAVYIGHDLAIHGTDKPELLGQRVSHGCIRMHNRDAMRLYHNVQIGTEVVIVGGEHAREQRPATRGNDPSTFDPGKPKPKPRDVQLEAWKEMPTGELLWELDEQLWGDSEESRWPEVASLLLKRGIEEADDDALAGLMLGIRHVPDERLEREYRTFLADAYARGARRTLTVLSELDRADRKRAAEAIVAASLNLHPGDLDGAAAPWPTRRVPEISLEWDERLGWNALERAERDFRRPGERRSA
jgi:hypothetical protein